MHCVKTPRECDVPCKLASCIQSENAKSAEVPDSDWDINPSSKPPNDPTLLGARQPHGFNVEQDGPPLPEAPRILASSGISCADPEVHKSAAIGTTNNCLLEVVHKRRYGYRYY